MGASAKADRAGGLKPRAGSRLGLSALIPCAEKPYKFDQMADPLLKAVRFAYKLERRNRDKSIPWRGPKLGERMRACSPDFKHRLSADALAYCEEDQGRDALEEIIGVALQIGIEQGRRITLTDELEPVRWELKLAELLRDSDTRPADGDAKQGSARE